MACVARHELDLLEGHCDSCSVVYIPMIGYLVAVPQASPAAPPDQGLPGLTFMFASNETSHYKGRNVNFPVFFGGA